MQRRYPTQQHNAAACYPEMSASFFSRAAAFGFFGLCVRSNEKFMTLLLRVAEASKACTPKPVWLLGFKVSGFTLTAGRTIRCYRYACQNLILVAEQVTFNFSVFKCFGPTIIKKVTLFNP